MKFAKTSGWTNEDVIQMRRARAVKALREATGGRHYPHGAIPTSEEVQRARASVEPEDRRMVTAAAKWWAQAHKRAIELGHIAE